MENDKMKKILKSLLIISIFVLGVVVTGYILSNANNKEVKQVVKESNDSYYIEVGEEIIEFTDGSYIVVDANGSILE